MLRAIKWIGIIAGSLAGLLLVAVLCINAVSFVRQRKTYTVAPELLVLHATPDRVRGQHLTEMLGCRGCHMSDLGGQVLPPESFAMGRLVSRNLTRGDGGVGKGFTNADYVRAIRYGVGTDNRTLVFMPSASYEHLSDADLASVIEVLDSAPPVNRVNPSIRIGPMARVLGTLTDYPLFSAEHTEKNAMRTMPSPTDTLAYGTYLIHVMGCNECHSANLAGNPGSGAPNITSGGPVGKWSEYDFYHAIRDGKRPDGTTISDNMPWKEFRAMSDQELDAVWRYIHTVPPVAPKK
jgi:mono/diheme cytochrome c family protein